MANNFKIYNLDDEAMCPHCGKSIDNCPARDLVVFGLDHKPTRQESSDRCGWCDETYYAQAISDTQIKISQS